MIKFLSVTGARVPRSPRMAPITKTSQVASELVLIKIVEINLSRVTVLMMKINPMQIKTKRMTSSTTLVSVTYLVPPRCNRS